MGFEITYVYGRLSLNKVTPFLKLQVKEKLITFCLAISFLFSIFSKTILIEMRNEFLEQQISLISQLNLMPIFNTDCVDCCLMQN